MSPTGKELTLSQSKLISQTKLIDRDDPAYDEESPPGKWFKPSESDTLDNTAVKELPSNLRIFRKYNFSELEESPIECHEPSWISCVCTCGD
ncbi:hypothetical protein ACHAXM_002494 [Skeletonema potamos]|jgi:hypothetical protein